METCQKGVWPASQQSGSHGSRRAHSPRPRKVLRRSASLVRGRTDNRIRSPRREASSQQSNVAKGSRQNRCVSSREALALRARSLKPTSDRGNGCSRLWDSVSRLSPVGGVIRLGSWLDHLIDLRGRRRTAYGGESNCLIETKARDASKWCIPRADFCPVLRMSMGRDSLKRGYAGPARLHVL